MSEVTFDEDSSLSAPRSQIRVQTERLAQWLVEKKIAENVGQANLMLVGVAGICVVATLILIFSGSSPDRPPTPEERALLEATTPTPRR
jgi:hypothetical protein